MFCGKQTLNSVCSPFLRLNRSFRALDVSKMRNVGAQLVSHITSRSRIYHRYGYREILPEFVSTQLFETPRGPQRGVPRHSCGSSLGP